MGSGTLGYSGFVTAGGGSSPSGGGSTQLPIQTAGVGSGPVVGTNTYQNNALIGATALNFIIVNRGNEELDEDFTFDPSTGTITRPDNQWQAGDTLVIPYTPAS